MTLQATLELFLQKFQQISHTLEEANVFFNKSIEKYNKDAYSTYRNFIKIIKRILYLISENKSTTYYLFSKYQYYFKEIEGNIKLIEYEIDKKYEKNFWNSLKNNDVAKEYDYETLKKLQEIFIQKESVLKKISSLPPITYYDKIIQDMKKNVIKLYQKQNEENFQLKLAKSTAEIHKKWNLPKKVDSTQFKTSLKPASSNSENEKLLKPVVESTSSTLNANKQLDPWSETVNNASDQVPSTSSNQSNQFTM